MSLHTNEEKESELRRPLKRQRERKKSGASGNLCPGGLSLRPWVRFPAAPLFFLPLYCFKGHRTVTAKIISIGLRTWVSLIYQAPYAVMKLKFFWNYTPTCTAVIHTYYSRQHKPNLRLNISASFFHPTMSSTPAVVATSSEGLVHWSKMRSRRMFRALLFHFRRSYCVITSFWYNRTSTTKWRGGHVQHENMIHMQCWYKCTQSHSPTP